MKKFESLIVEKNFEQAKEYLLSKSMLNSIDHYNLAFLAFKENDLPLARFYLEKAKGQGLFSIETNQAFKKVKQELNIELVENNYPISNKIIFGLNGYGQDVYYLTAGIFLLFLLIAVYFKKYLLASISTLLLTCAVIVSYMNLSYEAYINNEETIVYDGPSKIFEEKQKIPIGVKIMISEKSKDWFFVKYPEAYRGWVHQYKALKL